MTKQVSFSKYEQELRREYRKRIDSAESPEDVKKFFVRTVLRLFRKVLGDKVYFDYEDVHLDPKRKDGFVVSNRLGGIRDFVSIWKKSDLRHIVKRMAEFAIKRLKHLDKHRDKTEAKMYPIPE
ncbi:MAG: hypothetical protein JSV60_06040 [Desulfobacterales bacterium]|nr:MAG: hypothetical protein JSV60_06040 [Desulfobacterales bacterium]